MNKNTKIALGILLGCALFAIAFYSAFRWYFSNNPVVMCGDDKYSTACLISYAVDLKLEKKPFIDCINSNSTDNAIAEDKTAAEAFGITTGTSLFLGQLASDSSFTGFYISVASYDELKLVVEDILASGVEHAQIENLKAVTIKVNANVKQYLEDQGLTGAEYDAEFAAIKPDIDAYISTFKMFNVKMKMDNIRGNTESGIAFIYFVDYGSQYLADIYTILIDPIKTDYIDTGKLALITKEYPISNELADSEMLAKAAMCAKNQNKYFEYSDFLHTL